MEGDCETAENLISESLPALKDFEDSVAVARGLHCLGELAYEKGNLSEAARLFCEALTTAGEKLNRHEIGQSLAGMAAVLFETGNPLGAAQLIGAADRIRRYLGSADFTLTRGKIDGLLARAADDLPSGALDAAREQGLAMSPEEAIAFALQQAP
jgi:hypothetical protein